MLNPFKVLDELILAGFTAVSHYVQMATGFTCFALARGCIFVFAVCIGIRATSFESDTFFRFSFWLAWLEASMAFGMFWFLSGFLERGLEYRSEYMNPLGPQWEWRTPMTIVLAMTGVLAEKMDASTAITVALVAVICATYFLGVTPIPPGKMKALRAVPVGNR